MGGLFVTEIYWDITYMNVLNLYTQKQQAAHSKYKIQIVCYYFIHLLIVINPIEENDHSS
jgi:hypothetical protein